MKTTSLLSFLVTAWSASAFIPSSNARHSVATTTTLSLAVGEAAPDFSLVDQNGKTVTRSQIKKPLVVYFYPADSTPGCTVQANAFNAEVKEIRSKYGAELVGISGQGIESKQKFAKELDLDFSILADNDNEVRSAFGVPKAFIGLLPGRVTYVLDKKGVCLEVYDELKDAASHVQVAKECLAANAPANKFASFFG